MQGPNRRVTTTEVSARCGVSTRTVPRVIASRPDVAPDTRERFNTDTLRYAPSAAARTLVARSCKTMRIPGAVNDDVAEVDGDSTSGVAVPLRAELMIHESTGGPVAPEPGWTPVPAQASADRA